MRNFPPSNIFTRVQLARMIDQLEEQKPEYVFMERIFLTPQVPQWYGLKYEDLIDIIRYVLSHYQVVDRGEYLVALKRVR